MKQYIRKVKLFSSNPILMNEEYAVEFDQESQLVHARCTEDGYEPVDTKVVASQGKVVLVITGMKKIYEDYPVTYGE